ncbi:hypothetical protein QR680_000536 [Steinernema hermaphroditum]|uniref:Acetyl-coenzyme A carboxylase carboxyl transferase subunit beta domain-containing protein n=1 Tax=Steinernema hermaphroditum TaxID=289476 RepID=A0AA39GUX6_9BILA|nr:hypothetical protein QR680_000536 [Steinernema hermaphroditum]
MIYTSGAEGVAVVSAYHIVKGDVNYELIPCSNALHHCCTRSYAFESHTPILQSHAQKKRLIARNIGNIAKVVMQEGQIWYPDCAYKDDKLLSWEGFPLVILAEDSLEDLSGGQKDVFDMALKYGAEIVAALQAYVQSIVIYMPPFGELRGGAWAVLDPKINTTCIKMIADPQYRYSRTRIKYRAPQLEQLTSREDNEVQKLKRSLANSTNDQTNCAIQKQIVQRIEYLKPLYGPAAVRFADLHDRARRMLAKVSLYAIGNHFFLVEIYCRLCQSNFLKSGGVFAVFTCIMSATKDDMNEELQLLQMCNRLSVVTMSKLKAQLAVTGKKISEELTSNSYNQRKAEQAELMTAMKSAARDTLKMHNDITEKVMEISNHLNDHCERLMAYKDEVNELLLRAQKFETVRDENIIPDYIKNYVPDEPENSVDVFASPKEKSSPDSKLAEAEAAREEAKKREEMEHQEAMAKYEKFYEKFKKSIPKK